MRGHYPLRVWEWRIRWRTTTLRMVARRIAASKSSYREKSSVRSLEARLSGAAPPFVVFERWEAWSPQSHRTGSFSYGTQRVAFRGMNIGPRSHLRNREGACPERLVGGLGPCCEFNGMIRRAVLGHRRQHEEF